MRRAWHRVARHLVMAGVAVSFLLPIWWVMVMSLRPTGRPPSTSIEWWPGSPAWENYRRLFELVPLLRQTGNSLLVGLVAVPLTLMTASLAGYAMANAGARLRKRLVTGTLLLMLVPVTALWLTRFAIFKQLGLMNSPLALILPALSGTNPFYILLFYWTFRRIPREDFEGVERPAADGHYRRAARDGRRGGGPAADRAHVPRGAPLLLAGRKADEAAGNRTGSGGIRSR